MELSRRDAVAALAAGGAAGAVGVGALGRGPDDTSTPADGSAFGGHERETLVAVARVVYPSALDGVAEFVRSYLRGRTGRAGYAAGAAGAVATLDDLGREWHGGRFVDLDPGSREALLREIGADTAEADPGGSPAERVRYYLVDELLYGLYASPTGGELAGTGNPVGHPGGLASYRRGPDR